MMSLNTKILYFLEKKKIIKPPPPQKKPLHYFCITNDEVLFKAQY